MNQYKEQRELRRIKSVIQKSTVDFAPCLCSKSRAIFYKTDPAAIQKRVLDEHHNMVHHLERRQKM